MKNMAARNRDSVGQRTVYCVCSVARSRKLYWKLWTRSIHFDCFEWPGPVKRQKNVQQEISPATFRGWPLRLNVRQLCFDVGHSHQMLTAKVEFDSLHSLKSGGKLWASSSHLKWLTHTEREERTTTETTNNRCEWLILRLGDGHSKFFKKSSIFELTFKCVTVSARGVVRTFLYGS